MLLVDTLVFVSYVITIDPFVNLNESNSFTLSIFPNPSNGNFQIQSPVNLNTFSIEIFDVSGRLIVYENMDGYNQNIDISYVEEGVYFCKIKDRFQQVVHSQKIFIL